MRPVDAGLIPYTALKDGSVDLADVARMNDWLDLKADNENSIAKWREAMNAETLKDFLISLGFNVDEAGARKFDAVVAGTTLKAIELGVKVEQRRFPSSRSPRKLPAVSTTSIGPLSAPERRWRALSRLGMQLVRLAAVSTQRADRLRILHGLSVTTRRGRFPEPAGGSNA